MASSAISSITSFGGGGVGHNATGTASWRGGFTEVNEQGGEIIDLPSGARIYPHATTMKMLQRDLKAGKLDDFIQSSNFEYDALGNLKGYSGTSDNLVLASDLSPIRDAKIEKQRELMLSSAAYDFSNFGIGSSLPQSATSSIEYDALGNIKGYTGMADNLIQEGDLSPIREAKLQKQRELMGLSAFPAEIQTPELSAFPQAFDVSDLTQGISNNSTTNSTTTNTNNNGLTVTGNTFTINKGSDIDELVFKIFQMMSDAQANYAGA